MARKGKRKGHGMPHGFVSKKQMRYFFANADLKAKYAHKEAHKAGMHSSTTKALGYSPVYRALPVYKRGPTAKGTAKRAK
jgi:hypothetical protein